jgi:hypothetical protein
MALALLPRMGDAVAFDCSRQRDEAICWVPDDFDTLGADAIAVRFGATM